MIVYAISTIHIFEYLIKFHLHNFLLHIFHAISKTTEISTVRLRQLRFPQKFQSIP